VNPLVERPKVDTSRWLSNSDLRPVIARQGCLLFTIPMTALYAILRSLQIDSRLSSSAVRRYHLLTS
jgi:hypothetical protein